MDESPMLNNILQNAANLERDESALFQDGDDDYAFMNETVEGIIKQPPLPPGPAPAEINQTEESMITVQSTIVEEKVSLTPTLRVTSAPTDDRNNFNVVNNSNASDSSLDKIKSAPPTTTSTANKKTRRTSRQYAQPPRLALKECSTAQHRHKAMFLMRKDKRMRFRIMHRIVVTCSFFDPIIWALSFMAIYYFVRPTIVNPDRTGWELTRRVRSLSEGYASVQDSTEMWQYLRRNLMPNLAPNQPTTAMKNTYLDYVFAEKEESEAETIRFGTNVQTLNDGRLTIVNTNIYLRQIRGFGFSTSNIVEDDNKIVSWMTGNETQTSLDLNKACNNKGSSKNQSIIPIYISDKKSKNTNTFSPLTGKTYSGSAYTTKLDLTLRHIKGPTSIKDLKAANLRLEKGMQDREICLKEQLNQMETSGWIDTRTRAVIVEYCVIPFFLSQRWHRNLNTTNRRGQDFEDSIVDGIEEETFGTAGCQRIIFEFDQFGSVDASQFFITSPISSFHSKNEHFIVTVVLLVSLGLLLWNELLEIYVTGAKLYLCSRSRALFNLLDLFAIVFVILTVYSYPSNGVAFGPEDFLTMLRDPTQTHVAFFRLMEMDETRKWFSSLLIVWWARSLEYLSLFPALQVPVFTISRASLPIFSILIFIAMITFAVSYGVNIVFGASVDAFSDLSKSLVTLIQASLGEISLDGFQEDTRWSTSGPVIVALWAFVMMFVVLTMFVAIIDESFSSVREDVANAKEIEKTKQKNLKKIQNDIDIGTLGIGGDMSTNVIRNSCKNKRCCQWYWFGLCADHIKKGNGNENDDNDRRVKVSPN